MFATFVLDFFACAAADRLRSEIDPKALFAILYGVFVASIATTVGIYDYHISMLAGLGLAIGSGPGWGQPMGYVMNHGVSKMPPTEQYNVEFEWWQKGILRDWPILALFVRGVMWGILFPVIAMLFPEGRNIASLFPVVAFAIAMPLSALCAHVWFKNHPKRWPLMEYLRGAMVATVAYAYLFVV